MPYDIRQGDVSKLLPTAELFDACFCDPPYGLSFMGKAWDHGVPSAETWRRVYDSLKPGAPLLAFGGTRTYHRLVCAIEDAGFEIRDTIAWIYGQGMPKPATTTDKYIDEHLGVARDVTGTRMLTGNAAVSTQRKGGTYGVQVGTVPAKEIATTAATSGEAQRWEGYGHALRPSIEPICLARKPLEGSIAENVLTYDVGGLNVEGCRLRTDEDLARKPAMVNDTAAPIVRGLMMGGRGSEIGRWPANVILDEEAGEMLDAQTGVSKSQPFRENVAGGAVMPWQKRFAGRYTDDGGASRFFYCAKVSRAEREAGCEHLPKRTAAECTDRTEGTEGANRPQAGANNTGGAHNFHPTLKPIELTKYLAKLVLPPKRTSEPMRLLVPFSGAGSEMIGAILSGWEHVLGIEQDPEYIALAVARMAYWTAASSLMAPPVAPVAPGLVQTKARQLSLFAA